MSNHVAIVTGSNKGLGFAIVKRLCRKFKGTVYLTSRDINRGRAAVSKLNKLGLHPEYHQLDITDRESIANFKDYIIQKHGGIDILINNAGVKSSVLPKHNYEDDKQVIDINFKSMLTMQEIIFPLIRDNGRILNISSNAGHLSNVRNEYWIKRLSKEDLTVQDVNEFVDWYLESSKTGTFNKDNLADNGSIPGYRVSKVALCALTRVQQREMEYKNISVNSMHPGILRTEMTLGIGVFSADQAAVTPVYLVLDAPQSVKGEFVWHDGRVIDWCDYNLNLYHTMTLSTSIILYGIFNIAKDYYTSIFKK